MSLFNTKNSYGGGSRFLHWVIAFLVIGMLVYGFYMEDIPQPYRSAAFYSHKLLGLTILFLMLLRIAWALINEKPAMPFNTQAWESFAEKFVHYSLYLALIAMPMVAWVGSVAGGRTPRIGSFEFYLPVAYNKDLSHLMFKLHKQLAWVIIALLIIHVAAALFHHFVRRDKVLNRMLP